MKSWFTIRNVTTDSLTIDILDEIGYWGVTAKDFAAALKAAGSPKNITLRLDCPGGDCNDGFTIFDAIKATGAHVTVEIIGLAASMASVIMLSGNKIRIAENGRVMIHRVTAGARGNADELDAAAKIAKQFEDRIVAIYVARTGKTEEQIREWMQTSQGTWFFGAAAVTAGFADELITGQKALAFNNRWAAKFEMLPAALFDISAASTPPTAPSPKMKLIIALASLAGIALKGDETEDQLEAAIKAHKPAEKKFEMNLDDPETKKLFDTAVTAGITEAMKPVNVEITALRALITNGVAASAGAGTAIAGGKSNGEQLNLMDQFNAIKDPTARNAFFKQHAKELRASGYATAA